MTPKPARRRHPKTYTLSREIIERLTDRRQKTGTPVSQTIEHAVKEYLDRIERGEAR